MGIEGAGWFPDFGTFPPDIFRGFFYVIRILAGVWNKWNCFCCHLCEVKLPNAWTPVSVGIAGFSPPPPPSSVWDSFLFGPGEFTKLHSSFPPISNEVNCYTFTSVLSVIFITCFIGNISNGRLQLIMWQWSDGHTVGLINTTRYVGVITLSIRFKMLWQLDRGALS